MINSKSSPQSMIVSSPISSRSADTPVTSHSPASSSRHTMDEPVVCINLRRRLIASGFCENKIKALGPCEILLVVRELPNGQQDSEPVL